MIVGQLGFRYTKFIKRFTLSTDFKAFGGEVFQSQETSLHLTTSRYAVATLAGVTTTTLQAGGDDHTGTTYSGRKGTKATVGFDFRSEGSFKATKHLDLRGGFALLYIGRGIWRGSTSSEGGNQFSQNQSVIMPAFTFGVALNR